MATLAVVVCPLEFERRALERAGLGQRCALHRCGPGAASMRRWAEGHPARGPVILCGLAGSLRREYPARQAYVAAAVLAGEGRRLEPTLRRETGGPLLISSAHTLTSSQGKRDWARQSGADLVDRESAAFAAVAVERGWQWSVVRAVSDGPDTELPRDIDAWVDDAGCVRFGFVLRAILRGRAGPVALARLRGDGAAGLRAAARLIAAML
jgi:hypothetical protein